MADLLRSISLKIFGIAVGLLVIMAAAALWAGLLTQEVHLQLNTLNRALFPMTLRIAELQTALSAEVRPPREAGPACRARVAALSGRTAALIGEAQRLRDAGARMAVLERNRIELARLEPMLSELAYQHGRLARELSAGCAGPANPASSARAAEVTRLASAINREIGVFVLDGAAIVGGNQRTAQRATLVMIGAAGLVGLMLAWLVARGLTRPIARLRAGAIAVGRGQLETEVPVTTRDEIGDVTAAFNAMVAELREKERIKETFGQYVDPRVVAGLVAGAGQSAGSGEKQVATVFFSDIAGFTALSERLAPTTLVQLINGYFTEMSGPIRDRAGVIDKYIGDAIMAFWVPPFADPTVQAAAACEAALEQLIRLDAFAARIPDLIGMRRDIPRIAIRIGIATGEVVVGSIGSEQARSFTVMGDTVNLGARLEGANKAYGTRILIDDATRDAAGAAIEVREIDCVGIVGRDEPLRIYELAAMAGDLPPERRALFDRYEDGLRGYRSGDWRAARAALEAVLEADPGDGPAAALLGRMASHGDAPPAGWSGVSRLEHK